MSFRQAPKDYATKEFTDRNKNQNKCKQVIDGEGFFR